MKWGIQLQDNHLKFKPNSFNLEYSLEKHVSLLSDKHSPQNRTYLDILLILYDNFDIAYPYL